MLSRVKNLLSTQRLKEVFVPLSSNEAKNSGQWHPHMHMIWLCSEAPDAHQLSREWEALTGDSFIVDVRPMYGEIDGFLETFKYALKFSDLNCQTICMPTKHTERQTPDKQFWRFARVEVSEELTDDDLDDDLPYMLMLYTYRKGSGYNFSEQWTEDLS